MKHMMLKLISGTPFTFDEAQNVMENILSDKLSPEQIGFFLAAYEFRTPTGIELAGFTRSLLKKSISVGLSEENLVDVCGTGGDGLSMFNVSTCVAFVVAATGQKVAKHGNRAVSSRCGSFDVLEALDFSIAHNEAEARISIENYGLTFLFAPSFHPILGILSTIRKNLGVRTILNALGPLLNPAGVKRQLIGVYSPKLLLPMAEALRLLGAEEAMIVHGEDGSDEISLSSATQVAHLKDGKITEYKISPEQFNLNRSSLRELSGGEIKENVEILIQVLNGTLGPQRDVTLLNAAASLLVAGKVGSIESGIILAREAIDSGRALKLARQNQMLELGA